MQKKLLLIFLAIAMLIDGALAALIFFDPAKALELFKISYNSDTAFLAFVIGWFCVFFCALCILAMSMLKKDTVGYRSLIFVLGLWKIAIGIGIYFAFKKTDNLLLDSLNGMIIVGLNYWNGKKI